MKSKVLWQGKLPGDRLLRIVQNDITREEVDAIVNAANSALQHGGGVAGAIVRAGGQEIQDESDRIAPVPTGQAAQTGAGRLPVKAVIHAVGPRMGEGDEDKKLRGAVTSALQVATENDHASISMPAISSGIFGYPKDRCARVLHVSTVLFFEENPESSVREVRFCNFDDATCDVFIREIGQD